MCDEPRSVAELAADLRLPLGVVRVILADLREQGLIAIRPPVSPVRVLDTYALRRIENGLRRL
jgi:DNA-binding GntR family transcriptional regulator